MKFLDHGQAGDSAALEKILCHTFTDRSQLKLALTHTSARTSKLADYERLEFLGDRVLALLIAGELLTRFPAEKEGDLAKRLAQLVRKETLAAIARDLKLGSFIVLSKGENASGGRDNPSVLADVCEAVIAALYLDGGLPAAAGFVLPNWMPLIVGLRKPPSDAKTELQEWAQGLNLGLPAYKTVSQTGPSHDPLFVVAAQISGRQDAPGRGRSKRQAEQEAAKTMLLSIRSEKKTKKKRMKPLKLTRVKPPQTKLTQPKLPETK